MEKVSQPKWGMTSFFFKKLIFFLVCEEGCWWHDFCLSLFERRSNSISRHCRHTSSCIGLQLILVWKLGRLVLARIKSWSPYPTAVLGGATNCCPLLGYTVISRTVMLSQNLRSSIPELHFLECQLWGNTCHAGHEIIGSQKWYLQCLISFCMLISVL